MPSLASYQTSKGRLGRTVKALKQWCEKNRLRPVKEQCEALRKRLVGHYNYFEVNGDYLNLAKLNRACERVWYCALRRHSQRDLPWSRFQKILQRHALPKPRIKVQIW